MVVLGQKGLYWGKSESFGKSIRAKVVVFEQSGWILAKVVVFVQGCCIRANVVVIE